MELVTVNKEDKEKILQKYEMDQEKIDRDVRIVEEWLAKQPHLPREMQFENFIEKVLLNSKFRIEVAKEKIDSIFCMRGIVREYYEMFAGPEYMPPSKNTVAFVPLPRLGPSRERLVILKMRIPNPDLYEFHHYIQLSASVLELMMRYDYCDGLRVIADMEELSLSHIKKIDIATIPKIITMLAGGHWFRFHGMEFVNFKPYQALLINLCKAALKPKMAERLIIHDNLESLYRRIPREYLPKDLGGPLENSLDLVARVDHLVEENRQYLIDCLKFVSNEKLRMGAPKYTTNMFGVDGTFKKLNVD